MSGLPSYRAAVAGQRSVFWAGGLEAVRQFHWYQPSSALAPHRQRLEAEFSEHPPHTVAEACERIEQLTGIRRKVAAVPALPKKSVEEHAAEQADFLKDEAGAAT